MSINDIFQVNIPRSLIGNNAIESLAKEAKGLGARKVLIVTDKGLVQGGIAERVKRLLQGAGLECAVFPDCLPDAPVSAIKACAQFAQAGKYELLVALGGGSVMDTTKLVGILATAADIARVDVRQHFSGAVGHGLPKIMVPTTAGTGAEWTAASAITEADGVKNLVRHDYLLGDMVIVDPGLTAALPPRMTADTGIDALSHAIDASTSRKLNPLSEALSDKAIQLIATSLRTAFREGTPESRYNMSLAATISCMVMVMNGGAQLGHGMGHVLQGKAHCTHGVSLSILMPYIYEYTMVAGLPRFARLAELMGEKVTGLPQKEAAQKSVDAVRRLSLDLALPQRLRDVGLRKEDIPVCADLVMATQSRSVENNIRPVSVADVRNLYEMAW